ncbi:TlpA disulfide reductase family protein [Qipengyuania sp. JC766]|uniref:TlpA family protein disulfide reductase n=1 Tax=Qipengyuania sp. JC766 TaxID=3232139 RepID=UPI0034594832
MVSLTLAVLTVPLAGCDNGPPDTAQDERASTPITGEIDASRAGDLLPAAELVDPDGDTVNTAALQGRPLLVNLWATWCAPCRKEMPLLDELAGDMEGDLRVLTVSQDVEADIPKVDAYFAEFGFANLTRWVDPTNSLALAYGNIVLPTTVLYGPDGTEIWRVTGDYDWSSAEAREAIAAAIADQ